MRDILSLPSAILFSLFFFFLCGGGTSAEPLPPRPCQAANAPVSAAKANASGNSLEVVTLRRNGSGAAGTGDVAIAGGLSPFGKVGAGCGVNWKSGASFGGGLQAGSSTYGLGAGFAVNATNNSMTVGLGVNVIPQNTTLNIEIVAAQDGTISIVVTSNSDSVKAGGAKRDIVCDSTTHAGGGIMRRCVL